MSASASAAAPVWRATVAMTAMELRLALRRGETLVATVVLPVIVLVFFSSVVVVPTGAGRPVDFLLPGSIAFAIIATSLVSDHDRVRPPLWRAEAPRWVAPVAA